MFPGMKNDDVMQPLRIVILDDDLDLAQAMQAILELRGHAVSLAGELVAAWCEVVTIIPDVFVADLWIGPEQSVGLLASVRLLFGDKVRCVLVSGARRNEWNYLLDRQLVHDALSKPFESEALVKLVEGSRGGR
jgi:DNA-binding NtrC family response regulator